jgi:hypothetical protein
MLREKKEKEEKAPTILHRSASFLFVVCLVIATRREFFKISIAQPILSLSPSLCSNNIVIFVLFLPKNGNAMQ